MKYEIVESAGEWIVRDEGGELARFPRQEAALGDVAERLKSAPCDGPVSLAVRFEPRAA